MARLWTVMARIWRLGRGDWRWRVLWLANPKFVVGVTGVVTNPKGEVLLLRHRFWRAGTWGLPSGFANRNETMEEAFAREVREETALEVTGIRHVRLMSGYKLRMEVHFHGQVDGSEPRIDSREILEARFFPADALPDGLLMRHRETVGIALDTAQENKAVTPVEEPGSMQP